nr:MAG TPA: hypothetical protein [Bacteriophage sp.]
MIISFDIIEVGQKHLKIAYDCVKGACFCLTLKSEHNLRV